MRRIPRISTRGYYDLSTGQRIKDGQYRLYPRHYFEEIAGSAEITVMVHGMRNDSSGAIHKVAIAQERLRHLGYGHPVVGFSYDSNTAGAHLARREKSALEVAQRIADMNGHHLGRFIEDFKRTSPDTRVRLMGHSLGSQVILCALEHLAGVADGPVVQSVHLFGASIPADVPSLDRYGRILNDTVSEGMVNYYAPTDEVLSHADNAGYVHGPLGLCGASGRPVSKYRQVLVRPENHRFASYAAVLEAFP